MNAAHFHLMINHLPLFSLLFATGIYTWALYCKSKDLRTAALELFVLAAASVWIAYFTGEGAEEIVESLQEVTHEHIHEHELAAKFSLGWLTVTGVLALVTYASDRFERTKLFRFSRVALMIAALFSLSVIFRTAYLGGQIRHSEIRETIISKSSSQHASVGASERP